MRFLILFLVVVSCVEACTAFHLRSEDGALVYGRSLEFGMPMDSNLLIVPRGTDYIGSAPGGKQGLKWKARYGHVGMNQSLDRTLVSDGMNEKGLVVGTLYLPGYAKYEATDPSKTDRTLGAWQLASYLLSMCATVQDAKGILSTVLVADVLTPGVDFVFPLHFYVSDKSGSVIIVEYVGGKRMIYDNPVEVLTNSPPFDWQLTNLSNYVNLTPLNAPDLRFGKWKSHNFSQGTGSLGMPGDYTPPSRFVRAVLYSHWAEVPKTASDCVRLAFHLLNTFDIFEGAVQQGSPQGNQPTDFTEWVVVHDQTNLKTYFRSYESLAIQMADLKSIDFNKPGLKQIPMAKEFRVENVTSSAKPLPGT